MSLFLSKLLPRLVYPLGLTTGLLLVAFFLVWWGRKRLAAAFLLLVLSILWFSSMPVTAAWLAASLERQFLPVPVAQSPAADAIVVLGGGVGVAVPPRLYPDLKSEADRVMHAARLFSAGKAPWVIVSGGSIPFMGPKAPESNAMRVLLRDWGVPDSAILLDSVSQNTRENALQVQRILRQRGLHKILLVTSAQHMRRALAVFAAAGIDAIASPTDYEEVGQAEHTLLDWLPDASSLDRTTRALKEYLGYAVYRWRGWL